MAGLWGLSARRAVLGVGAGWLPVDTPGHPRAQPTYCDAVVNDNSKVHN